MRFSRPVTAALFTYTATLIVLILALFFLVQETSAQKRTSKLNASPANPVEAAALEFALSAEELNALIGKKSRSPDNQRKRRTRG